MNRSALNFFCLCGALLLLASAVGCNTIPLWTSSSNIANSRNLRVGMTKSEVLQVMGEPIRDERFVAPDLWFYYIDTVWLDGLVTEDECMPLIFENGVLVGWGNDFYIDYRLKRKDAAPVIDPEKD